MDTEKSVDHRTLVRLFQSVDSPIDSISLSAKYCETYLKRHGMPFLSGLVFCSGSSVSLSVRFAEITSCRNSIASYLCFGRLLPPLSARRFGIAAGIFPFIHVVARSKNEAVFKSSDIAQLPHLYSSHQLPNVIISTNAERSACSLRHSSPQCCSESVFNSPDSRHL